jgi:hypothetical protein
MEGGIMTKHLKAVLCLGLAMLMLHGPACATQQNKPAPPAPIPVQILTAKKVFLANGGGDESRYDASYSGGPDRAYNAFYAAMKTWGRYELVAAPGDADLVFEIRLTVTQLQHPRVLDNDSVAYDAQFRLVIRDVKTRETLWGLTEHAQEAVLQSNRDKNFDQALAAIVAEVQRIAGPAAADPAKN